VPVNHLTHAALAHLGRLQNGEYIIDGAPARCRELDERNLATFEQAGGGTAGLKLLEADLVVTNRALCYVAYHLQMASIAEWEVLSGVRDHETEALQRHWPPNYRVPDGPSTGLPGQPWRREAHCPSCAAAAGDRLRSR